MKIWIDADACPGEIKDVVIRAGARLKIDVILVANKNMYVPRMAHVSLVTVAKGLDVADTHIVQNSTEGDLVVTADIPLAALLVPKKVVVIDPRGELFDARNIGERLSIRNFMEDVRAGGTPTSGPRPFDAKAKQRFAATLDRELTRLSRLNNASSTGSNLL